jgi:hypothetical protein
VVFIGGLFNKRTLRDQLSPSKSRVVMADGPLTE